MPLKQEQTSPVWWIFHVSGCESQQSNCRQQTPAVRVAVRVRVISQVHIHIHIHSFADDSAVYTLHTTLTLTTDTAERQIAGMQRSASGKTTLCFTVYTRFSHRASSYCDNTVQRGTARMQCNVSAKRHGRKRSASGIAPVADYDCSVYTLHSFSLTHSGTAREPVPPSRNQYIDAICLKACT
jgi:hypothetical protein